MQSFIATGEIYKDIAKSTTNSGLDTCRFALACPRATEKDGEPIKDFFSCIAWRDLAVKIGKDFQKGDKVIVKGEFHTGSYTDKNGAKQFKTELTLSSIEMLSIGQRTIQKVEESLQPISDEDLPF